MILTKNIIIKRKGCSNLDFYKNLGYEINNDFFEISINHLSNGSKRSIDLKCDTCGCLKKMLYKDYNRFNEFPYYHCNDCKRKKTNLERYGVEYTSTLKDVKKKKEETNLKKYGFIVSTKNEIVKKKIKKTNLEKWGVDNVFKSEEIKKKIKKTNLEKYGNEHFSKTNFFLEKVIKTNNFLYNSDFYTQTDEYIIKRQKTIECNYESKDDYYKIIQDKIKETNYKKYNVSHWLKSDEIRKKFIISNNENYLKYVNNSISLFKCDLNKDHVFEISYRNYSNRINNNIPLCTICNPIGNSSSIKENNLYDYIKEIYDGKIFKSYKDKLEVDIFLPDLNVGFEFNGLYWHSIKFRKKNYHSNKRNYFKEKGILIYQIWENDWLSKTNIIKEYILNIIKPINCPKFQLKEIDRNTYIDFISKNSFFEIKKSSIFIGLYSVNQELVSVYSFLKKDKSIWILNSFSSCLNLDAVIKYFFEKNNPSKLYIKINNDFYHENVLKDLNIKLLKIEIKLKKINGYHIYNSGISTYEMMI